MIEASQQQHQSIEMKREETAPTSNASPERYFLCVDGGGSSCTAALISSSGVVSVGEAGPCNVTSIGTEAALSVISSAIQAAVSGHEETTTRALSAIPISAAWIALAGYDRPLLAPAIDASISKLLGIPVGPRLTVSTDIDLLSVKAAGEPLVDSVIVLVAGTGSVAMSYTRSGGKFSRTARVGGWGPLLGDDGSGLAIGKEALRTALRTSDLMRQGKTAGDAVTDVPALSRAIFEHFMESQHNFDPRDLLSSILAPPTAPSLQGPAGLQSGPPPPTKRIARVAQVVFSLAESGDDDARDILRRGSVSLAEMVLDLLRDQSINPARTALVLAGGTLKNALYADMLRREIWGRALEFGWVMNAEEPATEGARWLVSQETDPHA